MSIQTSPPSRSLYQTFVEDWLNFQLCGCILLIALTGIYGFFYASTYELQIVIYAVMFAVMGIGWSIAGGFAGQLLMGYISFFGVGAYLNALFLTKYGISPWLNFPMAGVVGAFLAVMAAHICVRFGLNEDYFGLFTVALTQILKVIFLNWTYAGRAVGVRISRLEDDFGMMSFLDIELYLALVLVLLFAVVVFSHRLQRGRYNLKFAAVREGPMAAAALGIHVSSVRRQAVGMSGFVAGVMGAFYSQFTGYIDPEKVFNLTLNFDFLLPPVVGGRMSLIGPVLGAGLLRPVKDILRAMLGGSADALYLIIYGVILTVSILLMPYGIAGILKKLHQRYLVRKEEA